MLHSLVNEKNIAAGKDSLAAKPSVNYDTVLTNPPFGKKSSIRVVNEEGEEARERKEILRDDFWATTSNKQSAEDQRAGGDRGAG
jgi:type I restriction enzyme M protein